MQELLQHGSMKIDHVYQAGIVVEEHLTPTGDSQPHAESECSGMEIPYFHGNL